MAFLFGQLQSESISLFSVGLWGIAIGLVFSVLALLAVVISRFGSRPNVTRVPGFVQKMKELEP
jgi:uncharacterized membrane protein